MDKILIELYVPSVSQTFDVYIPLTVKLYEIELLISRAVNELSSGYFAIGSDIALCDKETGNILDINLSVRELGLQNGSTLMLI